MFRDINNGNMAYYHTRKWFNLAGFSFKEISSNLRKFYISFKEICEVGSESPGSSRHLQLLFFKCTTALYLAKEYVILTDNAPLWPEPVKDNCI